MKATLQTCLTHEMRFVVPAGKTVPHLYPEAAEFERMPQVFATGFLVGLLEWACMHALRPHLDDHELTLGTHIDVSHRAPTPPGLEVTVQIRLTDVDGRRLRFDVRAHDGIDLISSGTHERHVVDREAFEGRVTTKASRATTRLRCAPPPPQNAAVVI
jgi:fluoroacetyl-CoA thioesterase